ADVVRLLLERGADRDAHDTRFDSTPLTFATVGSGERPRYSLDAAWVDTVRALLDAGASGVWITGKPPSDAVAALLQAHGITGDEEAEPSRQEAGARPPADPAAC